LPSRAAGSDDGTSREQEKTPTPHALMVGAARPVLLSDPV